MKIDINSLLKMPRMSKLPLNAQNSADGLWALIVEFYKPHFKMVEVGSLEGISTLLFAHHVDTVYSVDCYDYTVPETGRIPEHDWTFTEAERMFIARTKDVPNIVKIRKTSIEAAKDFADGSLDAVYIDAEHDEFNVRQDIQTWRRKIKPGGVLSGHDYVLPHVGKILQEEGFFKITVAPDTSWAVTIPTIDLVAVACTKVEETIDAMRKCEPHLPFSRKILFTNEDVEVEGIEVIKIDKLDYKGYNEFVAMKLWQWIGSDFVLLVQNDGYVTNPSEWTNAFLKYDYVGAPWPVPQDDKTYRTPSGQLARVGNGGFSLRSRKLLRAPTALNLDFTDNGTGFWHEDGFLCVHSRDALEEYGIKFAPVELAAQFSTELIVPETRKSFGGHKYV